MPNIDFQNGLIISAVAGGIDLNSAMLQSILARLAELATISSTKTWGEVANVTWNDLSSFTWGQLNDN